MKILINTPDLSLSGGVANHYKGLRNYWNAQVVYNYVGGRKGIPGPLILPFDYVRFIFLCLYGKYDVILLNPSLNKTAIARDAVFLKIATFLKKKCWMFWHGWSLEIVETNNKHPEQFIKKFDSATGHLVLSKSFKLDLLKWGIKSPIHLTTTKIDDRMLNGFEFKAKSNPYFTILFLTRIEVYKGIFIVLEAMKTLQKQYPNLQLIVAGDGSQLNGSKDFVKRNNLNNILFLGNIEGSQLIETFKKSDIYILPSYSEGMPTSVLEAMAFGLPIISRPVGGLNDFFEENKMGYLVESLEPKDFATRILTLYENRELVTKIGMYNHNYAKSHFLASQVSSQLESILKNA